MGIKVNLFILTAKDEILRVCFYSLCLQGTLQALRLGPTIPVKQLENNNLNWIF